MVWADVCRPADLGREWGMARLFGRRNDGASDADVPREWRKALAEVLARVDRGRVGLSGTVQDYVLTGSPESILVQVGAHPDAPLAFALWGIGPFDKVDDSDRQLCSGFGSVPPDVLYRWSRVLESVLVHNTYQIGLAPVGGGHWAEALIIEVANVASGTAFALPEALRLDHEVVERMLVAGGAHPSELLRAGFQPNRSYVAAGQRMALRRMDGYDQAVRRHAELLRADMGIRKAENQLVVLEMLSPLGPDTLSLLAAELAQMATSTSSQVRAQAAAPLAKINAASPLHSIATAGKPEERLHALRLLWSSQDAVLMDWARKQAADDRAPNVRALLTEWDRPAEVPQRVTMTVEVPAIDWRVPVTDDLRALLRRIWDEANRAIDKENFRRRVANERYLHQHGEMPPWRGSDLRQLDDRALAAVVNALESGHPPKRPDERSGVPESVLEDLVVRHAQNGLLGPVELTVIMSQLGVLLNYAGDLSDLAASAYNTQHDAIGRPTLLELSTVLDQLGVDGAPMVLKRFSRAFGDVLGRDWPAEDIAPFVAISLSLVMDAIAPAERAYYVDPMAPFRALATLPSSPAPVVETLWALALGTRKAERRPAQDALARVPGIEDRVVTALADGKADVRTAAAHWLTRLGYVAAVPALEVAVTREKQDVTMGALLDALQAFGQPVEKYLDRGSLAKQASKGLANGLPKDLTWLHWDALPAVHWADNGERLSPEIVRWFVVQAVKAKSPEPNAVLRQYCALFDPRDREALGQHLLEPGWQRTSGRSGLTRLSGWPNSRRR